MGAVSGLTRGANLRGVAPDAAVTAAAVAAGVLGLIDWPLLALAGGTVLVVRQLRHGQGGSSTGADGSAPAGSRGTTGAATGTRRTATKAAGPARRTAPAKSTTRKRAAAANGSSSPASS